MNVTIHLYTNALNGADPVQVYTAEEVHWQQSWRDDTGPETAQMRVEGDIYSLAQLFYSGLGYHCVAQADGLPVWEGMIYEMDFHAGTIARRRSLTDLYNHVRTAYIDEDNESQMTTPTYSLESIQRYGRRELIVTLDGYNTTSATQYAVTVLQQSGWPWARPSGMARGVYLDVTLAGYATAANWRYVSVGDKSTSTASLWLKEIIQADVEYVAALDIQENGLSVVKIPRSTRRAWNTLQEIAELGDGSSNPWRVYWDTGRTVCYSPISTEPRYVLDASGVFRYYPNGTVVFPWHVRPAVVRDMTYLVRPDEAGSWLDDPRDAYITTVTVTWDGKLSLRFGDYDDVQIADAMRIYENEVGRVLDED